MKGKSDSVAGKFGVPGEALPPGVRRLREASVVRASTDARIVIHIDESQDPQDTNEVPVQVNGRAYQIKRGVPVGVPPEVVVALENAVSDRAVPQTDEAGNPRGVVLRPYRRYPFRIVDVESQQRMDRWRKAREDRRAAEVAEQQAALAAEEDDALEVA